MIRKFVLVIFVISALALGGFSYFDGRGNAEAAVDIASTEIPIQNCREEYGCWFQEDMFLSEIKAANLRRLKADSDPHLCDGSLGSTDLLDLNGDDINDIDWECGNGWYYVCATTEKGIVKPCYIDPCSVSDYPWCPREESEKPIEV